MVKSSNVDIEGPYDPKKVEDRIYKLWEGSGFFNPNNLPGKRKKPFTVAMPPPNITGELHMGHALNAIIQDILVRQKRMQGFRALWIPGIDHAGIATQNVIEKKLRKEGRSRFDLGKEAFIQEIWRWKEEYGNKILNQFKKLGSSCDWSRTRFTMDEGYAKAVKEAFMHYYKKGWIYQADRVVNWCLRCHTSLSDLELEYQESHGTLWHIAYPLKKGGHITVATTRPETMLGDAAVAVNPKDKRYKKFIGDTAILPISHREIPIIADEMVDQHFGTGAVKVTPAHDLADYQIAQKHDLLLIKVIDERGKIIQPAPVEYRGLKTADARQKVLQALQSSGLLEKEEAYTHQVPKCYRCGTIIECIPSLQWFLKMDKLATLAKNSVKKGGIAFHPKSFETLYFHWLDNVKDWCISRQIWWGHKIPLEGQEDVLDTWFSSALWPFAVLGWPDRKARDLTMFYPTNVLSTARDIIHLWVARMVFSGMEFMKEVPFHDLYIHSTVLTKEGQRMSKSLGIGIDPLKMVDEFGADATRFGIAFQAMGSQDIRFAPDAIVMGKKFCNKIWNASRFVLQKAGNRPMDITRPSRGLTMADKAIMRSLKATAASVNKHLEKFEFGQACHALYDFFWHDFCDNYLEATKQQHSPETQKVLLHILFNSLVLLHPFMPFITEEIYQQLPMKDKKPSLMVEEWPS